eukprot:gene44932-55924_t
MCIRRYITNKGGRVALKELPKFFKQLMKDYSELMGDKKA